MASPLWRRAQVPLPRQQAKGTGKALHQVRRKNEATHPDPPEHPIDEHRSVLIPSLDLSRFLVNTN
jgi:hypothetical protein